MTTEDTIMTITADKFNENLKGLEAYFMGQGYTVSYALAMCHTLIEHFAKQGIVVASIKPETELLKAGTETH